MMETIVEQKICQNLPRGILTIMHRQNEITATLIQQQPLLPLPRDILKFKGDPLQCKAFFKAYKQGGKEKAGR